MKWIKSICNQITPPTQVQWFFISIESVPNILLFHLFFLSSNTFQLWQSPVCFLFVLPPSNTVICCYCWVKGNVVISRLFANLLNIKKGKNFISFWWWKLMGKIYGWVWKIKVENNILLFEVWWAKVAWL